MSEMSDYFSNFLGDTTIKDVANVWLNYEKIKTMNDAVGTSQEKMVLDSTGATQQEVSDVVAPVTAATQKTYGGLSLPVIVGLGLASLTVIFVAIKK